MLRMYSALTRENRENGDPSAKRRTKSTDTDERRAKTSFGEGLLYLNHFRYIVDTHL